MSDIPLTQTREFYFDDISPIKCCGYEFDRVKFENRYMISICCILLLLLIVFIIYFIHLIITPK